jgi:hypothetical protein
MEQLQYVDAEVVRVDMTEPEKVGDMPKIVIRFAYETEGGRRTINHFRSFTESALPWTEKDLRTLGWDPIKNGWAIDDLIGEAQPIAGAKCELVLEMDYYKPESPRLKVKYVNEVGGGARTPKNTASVQSAAKFAEQLRRKVGISKPAGSSRPAPRPQPKPAPPQENLVDADGIPF